MRAGFQSCPDHLPRQLLEESERYPVITVPLITKAPVINGTLNEDEWAGASVIRDLIYDATNTTQRSGLGARHRSRYFLQYDSEAIYIAARYEMPTWHPWPVIKHHFHNGTGGEDTVDIFMNPFGKFRGGEKYHFGGNAASNYFDRDLSLHGNVYQWNPKWEYKSHVFRGGWECEARMPFKGLDTPPPKSISSGSPSCSRDTSLRASLRHPT